MFLVWIKKTEVEGVMCEKCCERFIINVEIWQFVPLVKQMHCVESEHFKSQMLPGVL